MESHGLLSAVSRSIVNDEQLEIRKGPSLIKISLDSFLEDLPAVVSRDNNSYLHGLRGCFFKMVG
jgi:hypothetical protein